MVLLDTTEAAWQDVQMLTHDMSSAVANQSRFSFAHPQFNQTSQASLVSSCSSKPTRAVNDEQFDSQLNKDVTDVTLVVQQTNTADTSSSVTQILSAGQKKRVDVLFEFCFCFAKYLVEILILVLHVFKLV